MAAADVAKALAGLEVRMKKQVSILVKASAAVSSLQSEAADSTEAVPVPENIAHIRARRAALEGSVQPRPPLASCEVQTDATATEDELRAQLANLKKEFREHLLESERQLLARREEKKNAA